MFDWDWTTLFEQLTIGVVGGLVATGVYLAYQRWVTEYARWPFQVTHQEAPDPSVPGNFTAKLSVRNRTSTTTQFLISFRMADGQLCTPRSCCAEEEDRRRVEGWGSVPPGDTRSFEFSPAVHEVPITGVYLVAKSPTMREVREFDYAFERPFGPLSSLAEIPGCA